MTHSLPDAWRWPLGASCGASQDGAVREVSRSDYQAWRISRRGGDRSPNAASAFAVVRISGRNQHPKTSGEGTVFECKNG
jgi:hypothetical protein